MAPFNALHGAFRRGTQSLHTELDSLNALAVFKGRDVTPERYADALRRLYRPHCYLEALTAKALKLNPVFAYQHRAEALALDIQALQIALPGMESTVIDQPPGASEVWGYLYLLEGSRLGSAHIARMLKRKGGESLPTAFLNQGYAEPSAMAEFWRAAQQHLIREENQAQAIHAARQAFEFYIGSISADALQPQLLKGQFCVNATDSVATL